MTGPPKPGEAPPLEPCDCPEATLLREILAGQVPAADTPMWRVLVAAIETGAARLVAESFRQAGHAVSERMHAARALPAGVRADPGPVCHRYFCPGQRACLDCPVDRLAMTPAAKDAA